MSRLSTVKSLPPEAKAELDKRLAEGRLTLDGLVEFLEERGLTISRSALHRYRADFEKVAAKLRESREVAAAFVQELGAVPADDMGQMLLELVHTLTFRVANSDGADLGPKEVMFLAKTLKDLQDSRRAVIKNAQEIRAEEKKRLAEEMKARLNEAQNAGGLSPEAAREARRILGFGEE